ncbi:hypothetical protein E3N88_18187 [Mikania micrantha]|uniref:Uncharacterized protein n=1 Tax=Mikania micrantha TaxID=192012 RepID=A0A5N6NU50_9ASTR|nr:hypothetical protein E3N88_18187 [Mikania micrantha]
MAPSLTGEAFELINGDVSDSDSWQVIDPSDSDAGNFSSGDVSGTDDDEELVSDADNTLQHPYGSPSSDIPMQYLAVEITRHYQKLEDAYDGGLIDGEDNLYEEDGDKVEEEEEDGDDSDLNDELVPKWLNNKFERQRMRKLGKKVYPKMKKSKRLANQYNKPGCVHGKHGLGMKHNLICSAVT